MELQSDDHHARMQARIGPSLRVARLHQFIVLGVSPSDNVLVVVRMSSRLLAMFGARRALLVVRDADGAPRARA